MATNNGPQETPQAGGDQAPLLPAMPTVPPGQLYRGTPYLMLDDGRRHSIGWQDHRKAGPSFVLTTRKAGVVRVAQRFPLTERGWVDGWQTLNRLDASAAAAIAARLAQLEAGRRAKEALALLEAQSQRYLPSVTFAGGSDGESLSKGQRYDLRFLQDRVMVCPERSPRPMVELPYADVETVEVSEPTNQSAGLVLGMISGFALAGAVLGFFVLGVLGLFIGALVLGLIGGVIAAGSAKGGSIVRVRGRDAEFSFLDSLRRPDDVRTLLSEPLLAIRKANAAEVGSSHNAAEVTSGSIPDQLAKLAALLQQELITRDEFEHLKAKLLAES